MKLMKPCFGQDGPRRRVYGVPYWGEMTVRRQPAQASPPLLGSRTAISSDESFPQPVRSQIDGGQVGIAHDAGELQELNGLRNETDGARSLGIGRRVGE